MPAPSVKVSVTDIETGLIQSAGNHGHTYPTPVTVTGLTAGGSGSQSFTNQSGTTSGSTGTSTKSHHHE